MFNGTRTTAQTSIVKVLASGNVSSFEKLLPLIKNGLINGTVNGKVLLLEILKQENIPAANQISIAKQLIALGVNVNAQDENGKTALMLATEKANNNRDFLMLISALYRAKADGTMRDTNGHMFLDFASVELMEEMPDWAIKLKHLMKEKIIKIDEQENS